MEILKARNLTKVYGSENNEESTRALNRISFSVDKGEFVGIMGPSGSGKTTLLNMLSGIDKLTSGKVSISDRDICGMSKNELALFRRKEIGYVFQDFNLLDSLTLKENIMLPMILDKKSADEMEKKSTELMKLFEIYDIANKYPYNISGGQQQRVAVSRALINNPSIIFADEPTGNLDSKSSKGIMQCFEKMNTELKATILVVTHDAFAASYCNRVIFIKDGKIHSEIVKKATRKEFLDSIFNSLAVLGGESYDL
ncbi:ABC transporter ATP-binding protein [Clostridium algidicarnis]|uniref:ABC transporter ATP-binding protein n=1 Tax=Clostridium algidicarnis TaxID=37659 RepID=UPI001C0DA3CD|nr:ABC transporter ATP-binding protein [Clostridium algidicarnis]MBU3203952.1 ABC transporter ATP-binding protein [Clostridium algidicarnis]MBU3212106.1 ABC transporter ATP-binding protein [Clostridium algidicarnis]MBU3221389.1 ABC transporter ATP-binding protein [Clostridium algidicarnis]